MNKELETHVQQMAENLSKKGWNDGQKAGLDIGYQQGFKDADAVGFAEYCMKEIYNPDMGTTEEFYLLYLKAKIK